MRVMMLAAALWSGAAGAGQGQALMTLSDPSYSCTYIAENLSTDGRLQNFLIDYALGVVSGANVTRQFGGAPVLDLDTVDNLTLVALSVQLCASNPEMVYPLAVMQIFNQLLAEQEGG